jgi:hypothetical protein
MDPMLIFAKVALAHWLAQKSDSIELNSDYEEKN